MSEDLYVVDWYSMDVDMDEDDDDSSGSSSGSETDRAPSQCRKKFMVKAFCIDTNNASVTLNILDFRPYYYIKVPSNWDEAKGSVFIRGLKAKVKKWMEATLVEWRLINAKSLYGFTANDKYRYIKLSFTCLAGFYGYRNVLREQLRIFGLNEGRPYLYELQESDIHPLLRVMHSLDLKGAGWLHADGIRPHFLNTTTCNRELSVTMKDVHPLVEPREDIPKLVYMGFDIESDSSHGDFPLAKKDYQKLARDMVTDYDNVRTDRETPYTDADMRPLVATYLKYAFHPCYHNNNIQSVKVRGGGYPTVAQILSSTPYETVAGLNATIEAWAGQILQILDSQDQDRVDSLIDILETHFPALDTDRSDYYSCASQLVSEYSRLSSNNDQQLGAQPLAVTKLLLTLCFDPYYCNLNINRVFTKEPPMELLRNLVPSVYAICEQAHQIVKAKRVAARHRRLGLKIKADPGAVKVDDLISKLTSLLNRFLPVVQDDSIISIGSVFKRYGESDCYLKHIVCLGTTEPIDNRTLIDFEYSGVSLPDKEVRKFAESYPHLTGDLNAHILDSRKAAQYQTDKAQVVVEYYKTEAEVLMAWQRLVQAQDPDLVVGYNTFGFDYKYLYDRAEQLGIIEEFSKLGRIKGVSQKLVDLQRRQGPAGVPEAPGRAPLEKPGMGHSDAYYIEMYGRISIDLYRVMQRMVKLNSYRLDSVCKEYLYKSKVDITPAEIFIKQKGSAADRRTIAEYCLIDCILCIRLMDKFEIIVNNIAMSQVCSVPLSYLFLRGQGIKSLSLVARVCRQEGYLIPVLGEPEQMEKYEGAVVLHPDKAIHNSPVGVCDFNSLYPSCIISENLSHNSFVGSVVVRPGESTDYRGRCLDPTNKYEQCLVEGKYPGWDYVDIVHDIYKLVPKGVGRKAMVKVVDGHKICRWSQPPDGKKDIIPMILIDLLAAREGAKKKRDTFDKGSFLWIVYEGLQLAFKDTANSLYGILGSGTSPIRMREIAACTTATGRKLINFSADFVKQNYKGSAIAYGDSVASYTPVLVKVSGEIKIIKIEDIVGVWLPCTDSDKEYADLSGTDIMSWTEGGWTEIRTVIRHKLASTKRMFRVLTHTGLVDVTSDHSLLRPDGTEVSPTSLCVGDELLQHCYPPLPDTASLAASPQASILDGTFWYDADSNSYICADQVTCAQLALSRCQGYNVSLDTQQQYRLAPCPEPCPCAIREIHEIAYNGDYVYDLTTSNHHFQAGVGTIIVHNTDSIFCKFQCLDRYGNKLHGLDAVYKTMQLCTEAAMRISRLLKPPHNLEFEKAILPFILLSKKRYHGHYYTEYGTPSYVAKSMGIVLKRRDNAPIVKHIFGKMIDIIMMEHSIDKALEFVRSESIKVLKGEFPLDMFIIAKSLRSYYKKPEQIAHNVLAQRIGKRDPGNKPRGNDRISYAYIVNPDAVMQGDMIETPQFIIKNKCKIDYAYYITNQIAKPVLQIFGLAKRGEHLFDELLREYASTGWKKLTDYKHVKFTLLKAQAKGRGRDSGRGGGRGSGSGSDSDTSSDSDSSDRDSDGDSDCSSDALTDFTD